MVNSVRRQQALLGTFVEIGVVPAGSSAHAAIDAGFATIRDVQGKLSFHDPTSELSRLNRAPGVAIRLSPCSLRVLRLALAMMRASGGLFDCTVGGALVRRGILPELDGPPPLDHGDASDVVLSRDWALLRRPLRITLDGIAKGYAIDCAVVSLRQHRVTAGWINAGGDLRVFGPLSLPLERRELDGSAGTRQPGMWTVMARSAWRADALTKVAALAAEPLRQCLLERLRGVLLPVPVAHAQ